MRLTVFSDRPRRGLQVFCMALAICLMTAGLAGCGIKPGQVDPPQGEKNDPFPRTYPDPKYDPAPERLYR
jgi:predicted small lipoprotein YifL